MLFYDWKRFLDSMQSNGELISRLEQHATANLKNDDKPIVHVETKVDVPAKHVHKTLVQDGEHVSLFEGTTIAPNDEQTTKASSFFL